MANKKQLTIGDLIGKLDAIVYSDLSVLFDFERAYPTTVGCWRTNASIAALGWMSCGYGPLADELGTPDSGNEPPSVETLLTELRESLVRPHEAWKGGEYKFYAHTPLYVANPGNGGYTIITEAKPMDGMVILRTRYQSTGRPA